MRFWRRRPKSNPDVISPELAESTQALWVMASEGNGLDYLEHLNGVPWHLASLPPKEHECKPQTRGWSMESPVARCACGAISMDPPCQIKWYGRYWMERNSRKSV